MFGILRSLGLIALCFALSGCLTMRRGNTQAVSIDSSPQGATVEVQPDGQTFVTPDHVLLSRKHSHRLRFEKEGFRSETIFLEPEPSSGIILNVFWLNPIGIIAGVITAINSGSGHDLVPDSVLLELKPILPSVTPQPPGS